MNVRNGIYEQSKKKINDGQFDLGIMQQQRFFEILAFFHRNSYSSGVDLNKTSFFYYLFNFKSHHNDYLLKEGFPNDQLIEELFLQSTIKNFEFRRLRKQTEPFGLNY